MKACIHIDFVYAWFRVRGGAPSASMFYNCNKLGILQLNRVVHYAWCGYLFEMTTGDIKCGIKP